MPPESKISVASLSSFDISSNEIIESKIFSQNFDPFSSLAIYLNEWKRMGEKNKRKCRSMNEEEIDNDKGINLGTKRVGDLNISEAIKKLQNEPKWKKF